MSRSVLATSLYVSWALVAFGLRSFIQWRRTGRSGFNGISGRPGSVEWWGGILFIGALTGGAAGAWWHRSLPQLEALSTSRLVMWLGVVLFLIASAATTGAQAAMGTSWRIGVDDSDDTNLIIDGPFRLARNPIFTTMLLSSLGLVLIVPNALSVAALITLLIAIQIQVRLVEEPYLRKQHGRKYLAYANSVGRFIPRLGRLRP